MHGAFTRGRRGRGVRVASGILPRAQINRPEGQVTSWRTIIGMRLGQAGAKSAQRPAGGKRGWSGGAFFSVCFSYFCTCNLSFYFFATGVPAGPRSSPSRAAIVGGVGVPCGGWRGGVRAEAPVSGPASSRAQTGPGWAPLGQRLCFPGSITFAEVLPAAAGAPLHPRKMTAAAGEAEGRERPDLALLGAPDPPSAAPSPTTGGRG